MINLLIIVSLIIVTYQIAVFLTFKEVPTSLSETHYMWIRRWPKLTMIFPLFTFVVGGLLLVPWLNATPKWEIIPFLTIASLAFVGAAAYFKESLARQVHMTGAAICFIGAALWSVMYGSLPLVIIMLLLCGFSWLCYKKKWVYLSEMLAFIQAIIQLFIYYGRS